jgi:hypothetical protein
MSILRPVSVFLRNALVKQHPYFSCCASCGEIKTPLQNRLCASLTFPFVIDAVVTDNDNKAVAGSLNALGRHCPWIRCLYIVLRGTVAGSGVPQTEHVRFIRTDEFMPPESSFGPEAYFHAIPGISEYFLIVPPGCRPERDLLPLDFFTPNGIPLLRLRKTEDGTGVVDGCAPVPGIMAQTVENAAAFLQDAEATAARASAGYYTEAARWAMTAGKVVPAEGLRRSFSGCY